MRSLGCLIIDDVDPSLSQMTQLGRDIVGAPTAAIRRAVLEFAKRRGWSVFGHRAFAKWASEIVMREKRPWLVLDPLLPLAGFDDTIRRVRFTRKFDDNETLVKRRYVMGVANDLSDLVDGRGDVGVVDDVAASGLTLSYAAQMVEQFGGRIARILVLASSRSARDRIGVSASGAQWGALLGGDWQVVHLRDACPYLPFSGRATDHPSVTSSNGASVEVRVPVTSVQGNLWQVLDLDTQIHNARIAALIATARQLDALLGRPACVGDLGLLGPSVPALIAPGGVATGQTTLESLAFDQHRALDVV